MKVFLSVGATYTPEQEGFVRAFEEALVQSGCERLTVGRGQLGARQPIQQARDLMEAADAVVVLAFTRILVERALDKPGSREQKEITGAKYPTVWNQLEASMAFGLGIPLLVVLEEGLEQEAMLKDRFEFRALTTALDPAYFRSDAFKGVFADFKAIALERAGGKGRGRGVDPAVLTIGALLRDFRPDQLWKLGGALLVVASAIASGAYWLGKNL